MWLTIGSRWNCGEVMMNRRPVMECLAAWCVLLLHQSAAFAAGAVEPVPDAGKPVPPLARFVTIESPVTDDVIAWVRSTALELKTKAAQESRKPILVLEVPAGVSQFHLVYGLCDLITSEPLSGIKTIAWVPETVTGPNALIPLVCNEIVMHPDAKFGDLGRGKPLPADQQAIVQGIVDKRNNNRVNDALASALMDPQTTLLMLSVEVRPGEIESRLATEAEGRRLRDTGVAIRDSRILKEPGSPGIFSGEQARQEKILITQTAASRKDLADRYGLSSESLRETVRTSRAAAERPTLIEVKGMIEPVLTSFLMRQMERAVESGSKTLIFEIDSLGGHMHDSLELANAIADLEERGVRTVAFIPKEAISGAAIIALGCDEIYLLPTSKFGDCGPVHTAEGQFFVRAEEKVLSYLRNAMSTLASRKKRPPALAAAMCDKDLDVFEVVHKTNGTVWFMSDDEIHQAAEDWTKGSLVPETRGNLLLTVNGDRAHQLLLAEAPVRDFEELKERLGIPVDLEVQRAQRTWIDDLVFQLNKPGWVAFLFFIAIVCIYIELHTMTGALGLISAFCFILFFWAKWLGGTAGGLEILLFVFGLFALGMEMFVIPGVGVFGIAGVLSVVASLVMASQTFSLVDQSQNFEEATKTLGTLGVSILAVAGVAMTISRYLPRIPFFKHMILVPPGSAGLGHADEPRLRPDSISGDARVGRAGVARTLLRPSGKAEIDGRIIDVVSDGAMIPAGRPVKIVQITGNRIVVREEESQA